ncbi:hypothetical protein GCM10009799_47460 [Nocardiopsis rhodophaea]|uniref:DUF2637 domain-containing protein n=1 Tax=Nocardiopsis rhodophaea TaxID=280238 RepID=A0ABN2TM19_9ACTN
MTWEQAAQFTAAPPWWVIAALALAAAVVGQRWLKKRINGLATGGKLTTAHVVATGVVLVAAIGLITLAFAMSYAALFEAATWLQATPFGDLRWMFPIGIDAVIVYFLALDLLMEWQGRRHPLARYSAYLLSAITVVLNVSSSHGGGITETLGHAGPPLVIILISEGVACWIRYMAGLLDDDLPDRIPAGRAIAHPLSTLRVLRLMLGWGITDYSTALKLEGSRQYAVAMLRQEYGATWRSRTPQHVLWMLANGHDLPRAFALVDALTPSVPKTVADVVPPCDTAAASPNAGGEEADTSAPPSGAEDTAAVLARFGIADIEAFLSCTGDTPGGGVAQLPHPGAEPPIHGADTGDPTDHDATPDTADDQECDTDATGDATPPPEEGDSPLDRARRALAESPDLSAAQLAERIGCSRGHAWRLAREVRRETRDTRTRQEGDR